MNKLIELDKLKNILEDRDEKNIVFTNGCFDIIHSGHIKLLKECKEQGDILIVGLNSDRSVVKLKGICRPILQFEERATILSAIWYVDYIVKFDDETPYGLIKFLTPDVLVKGQDWDESKIVGAEYVKEKGGRIHRVSMESGRSSSQIIYSILRRYGKEGKCNGDNPQQFEEP
jgi:rfaE bifunctional protein nucleotidyltransferase chain/domain